MKIFQALVGYLALTALPFHPFAFASPLAGIYYDGYVNTTQYNVNNALMEHALGSIAESCQTLTHYSGFVNTTNTSTQNHSDSGDIIEARWAAAAPPVLIIIAMVAFVVLSILWVESDNPVRCNSFKL
jgi:hypothetical protein